MDIDSFLFKLKTALTYMDLGERITSIDGHLLDIQGYTLMLLAAEGSGVGAIVEIGSFMGKATCCLALGSKNANREKVHAVDRFTGSPERRTDADHEIEDLIEDGTTFHKFEENIRNFGVDDYVVPIKASSREAAANWNGPIRLLFIHADHSNQASRLDFELWSPHVIMGGLVAFHDIGHWESVTRFYQELLESSTEFADVVNVGGLAILKRVAPSPFVANT
jgi:predicted O-methyltransferase YrrM